MKSPVKFGGVSLPESISRTFIPALPTLLAPCMLYRRAFWGLIYLLSGLINQFRLA